jgi:hypothetical protein
MKQTAVDILYKFLYEMESFEGFDPYSFNQKDVFKKAKEMEKEQIKNAWFNSLTKGDFNSADEYYNETYKQQSVTDDTL